MKLETNKQNNLWFFPESGIYVSSYIRLSGLYWDTGKLCHFSSPQTLDCPTIKEVSLSILGRVRSCGCHFRVWDGWIVCHLKLWVKIYIFFKNYVKIFLRLIQNFKRMRWQYCTCKRSAWTKRPWFKSHLWLSYNSLHLSFNIGGKLEANSSIRILRTFVAAVIQIQHKSSILFISYVHEIIQLISMLNTIRITPAKIWT